MHVNLQGLVRKLERKDPVRLNVGNLLVALGNDGRGHGRRWRLKGEVRACGGCLSACLAVHGRLRLAKLLNMRIPEDLPAVAELHAALELVADHVRKGQHLHASLVDTNEANFQLRLRHNRRELLMGELLWPHLANVRQGNLPTEPGRVHLLPQPVAQEAGFLF